MNKQDKSRQGKRNRTNGAKFENFVRKDLEEKGWTVSKWQNNVSEVFEQDIGEYVRRLEPAKHKFNPYSKIMSIGNGFPDFICYRDIILKNYGTELPKILYEVIGCEAKSNGYLTKEERLKCQWLLDKQVFSKILIASRIKEGRKVEIKYKDFKND